MGCGCEREGGLLVIDAVGWRSMYFFVMPTYLFMTLPICDLFTQHVISLWRDTTSELWTPVLFSLLLNQSPPKLCLLLQFTFLQQFSIHSIRLILCVQQNQ